MNDKKHQRAIIIPRNTYSGSSAATKKEKKTLKASFHSLPVSLLKKLNK